MKKILLEALLNQIKLKKRLLINAEGYVLGRLLSQLNNLKKPVVVVNVDKMIISGVPSITVLKYRSRINSGNKDKGPFISATPQKLVKRIYRGMCNYRSKAQSLYHSSYFFEEPLPIDAAYFTDITKRTILGPKITVKELCKELKK